MYTTILLKARHLREIVVITKAKYLLQMLVPKFCTDSQSWSAKGTYQVSQFWFDGSSSLWEPTTGYRAEPEMSSLKWGGLHDVKHTLLLWQHERDPLPHTRLAPHHSHWSLLRNRGSTPSANDRARSLH